MASLRLNDAMLICLTVRTAGALAKKADSSRNRALPEVFHQHNIVHSLVGSGVDDPLTIG